MGKYGRLVSRLVQSVDYWAQAAMRRFVSDIDRRLIEQNLSRTQFAEKLGTTPAYVTKVMRGDVNFTLETMTKLALAVGGKLQVKVVDRDASEEWDAPLKYSRVPVGTALTRSASSEFSSTGSVANQPTFHYEQLDLAA
jgi:transcriptional regulator with XRE-family HTH domain